MIGGIIFDLDGVLIDSNQEHYQAWKRTFLENNIEFNDQVFKELFGMGNFEIIRRWFGEMPLEKMEQLINKKEELYREYLNGKIKPQQGMKELIKTLKKINLRLAIATGTPRSNLSVILKELNMQDNFDSTITGDEITKGKPNPDIFLKAAKNLELKPEQCIVVEDAVSGIEAAKNANMKCIAITTTRTRQDLENADAIIDSLEEINLDLIKKMED